MIFSVQNSNLTFSIELLPDQVKTQVRETVCGVLLARMEIAIQVCHMVKVMRRDFNKHHITWVPMTENHLGERQMMEEVADHVGMKNSETPDSWYVAVPFIDFLFHQVLDSSLIFKHFGCCLVFCNLIFCFY